MDGFGGVENRSFVLCLGKICRLTKSVARSSSKEEFEGVRNRSFGDLTRKNLEKFRIGLSES
jgi:hypothetical protein